MKKKFRLRLAVAEIYPQKLTFKLVGGNLRSMNGTWQIESVSDASVDLVMISHEVSVSPKGRTPEGVFYSVYKDNLKNGLKALREEIIKRS